MEVRMNPVSGGDPNVSSQLHGCLECDVPGFRHPTGIFSSVGKVPSLEWTLELVTKHDDE